MSASSSTWEGYRISRCHILEGSRKPFANVDMDNPVTSYMNSQLLAIHQIELFS